MNRQQRRASRQTTTKISELSPDAQKVMRALIRGWLEDTVAGQELLGQFSVEDAISHICELSDHGLVRFVKGPGELGDGKTFFRVDAVKPPGWHQGGRA